MILKTLSLRDFFTIFRKIKNSTKKVTVFITKRQCKETLSNPDKYIVISRSSNFDFINKENPYYEATYRIARFKIGNGNYETIFTNLSKKEFSLKEIKELYHARWGIETSFRNLKYEIGLNALHSKKIDLVLQEIYGKMIRFNISMIITQEAEKHMKHKKERKYGYAINVSTAIHIVQKFFTKKKRGLPPHIYKLIAKEIVPIRPDRSFDRVVETQSFIPFGCRLSY